MMPIFRFDGSYERTPLTLAGELPYMAPDGRARVKQALEHGCNCLHDEARTATLRRRNVAGRVAIWLQCDACGASVGSAMRREHHPRWQDYLLWNVDLALAYEAQQQEHCRSLPTSAEGQQRREAEYRARSADYDAWCRTSPEWAALVKLVAWRSRGHCEACLNGTADIVHHLTYSFGKLPPAWHLRAVCRTCHERLHTAGDDWCDYGMSRSSRDDG